MKNKVRYMGGVICESSSVDQMSQGLSAFKFLDQVNVDVKSTDPIKSTQSLDKITVPLIFQVISLWKRNNIQDLGRDVKGKVEVEVLDPEGNVLQSIPLEFTIPMTKIRARNILNVKGMLMTRAGEYCFQFREVSESGEKSEPLAKLCFDVNLNRL